MVDTTKEVLMKIINEVIGKEQVRQLKETYSGLNKEVDAVTKTTERNTRTQKEQTRVTGGYNKAGEQYERIVRTTTPKTKAQIEAEERRAKSLQLQADRQKALEFRTDMMRQEMARTGKTAQEVDTGFNRMGAQFHANRTITDKAGNSFNNFSGSLDKSIRNSSRFKMEYLGVMFAGMALQRTMAGLTQTSREWLGINEIISTTLGVVTLPAMMGLLNEAVLPLSEALMNLPEALQLGIGIGTVVFQAVGGLLTSIGMGVLGLQAMEQTGILPKGGGKMIALGIVGATVAIASFSAYLKGLTTEGMADEIIAAIGTGLGIGVFAIAAGASLGAAGLIGTISAAALVSVALTVNWFNKKSNKREALKAAGLSDEDIEKEMRAETTAETGSPIASYISEKTGIKPEVVQFGTTGASLSPSPLNKIISPNGIGKFISNLFKGSKAVGGTIPENGLYQLHQGEQVLRKDQVSQNNESIIINYNITASSMQEFESKLRESERRITSDIRRMI